MLFTLLSLLVPVVCGWNTGSIKVDTTRNASAALLAVSSVQQLRRVAHEPAIRFLAGLDLEHGTKPKRITKLNKGAPPKSDGGSAAIAAAAMTPAASVAQ